MAATALTVQEITLAGLTPAYVAANAEGNYFNNDGRAYLEVVNGGVDPVTVTINSIALCSYGFDHNTEVIVSNGVTKKIGTFPPGRFNDASGRVNVTYSGVTSVTVGVFKS
jgi:hypothetical protein